MTSFKYIRLLIILVMSSFFLSACGGKFPGADARKNPADPKERIKKNVADGKGFTFDSKLGKNGGVFEFASSNELWRASLDILDFMPLASVNYSGGIIITDWYSNDKSSKESIKISIRFLSNEVRSDALDIKIFTRICVDLSNCVVSEKTGNIASELKVKILKTAAIYKSENKKKK